MLETPLFTHIEPYPSLSYTFSYHPYPECIFYHLPIVFSRVTLFIILSLLFGVSTSVCVCLCVDDLCLKGKRRESGISWQCALISSLFRNCLEKKENENTLKKKGNKKNEREQHLSVQKREKEKSLHIKCLAQCLHIETKLAPCLSFKCGFVLEFSI